MVDFSQALGQSYQQVLQDFPMLQQELINEDLELGISNYYLTTSDHSIECTLDDLGNVSSIFVQFERGAPSVFDIHSQSSLASLRARFGEPIAKGRGRRSDVFGQIGGWVKFDAGGTFIHLEFTPGEPRIKMMTLMTHNVR